MLTVGFALLPQELGLTTGDGPDNPFAIAAWEKPLGTVIGAGGFVILACAVLSVVGLVVRYREAHGDERQQVKWLAYVGIATVLTFITVMVLDAIYGFGARYSDVHHEHRVHRILVDRALRDPGSVRRGDLEVPPV